MLVTEIQKFNNKKNIAQESDGKGVGLPAACLPVGRAGRGNGSFPDAELTSRWVRSRN
jgi:hypothetical protein